MTVKLDGIIHLKKRFPTSKYWTEELIANLPKNYIYINAPTTSYADVFFWVMNNGEYYLIGIQTKNKKATLSVHEIKTEWMKSVGRTKGG